jgi:hypothetical protein
MPIDDGRNRQTAFAVCRKMRILHDAARPDQHNRQWPSLQFH